jgi:hypothetical protein
VVEDPADLELPSGSTVRLASDSSLRTQLGILGIARAHTRPKDQIVLDYFKMIKRVHDAAGAAAVDAWLWQHRR